MLFLFRICLTANNGSYPHTHKTRAQLLIITKLLCDIVMTDSRCGSLYPSFLMAAQYQDRILYCSLQAHGAEVGTNKLVFFVVFHFSSLIEVFKGDGDMCFVGHCRMDYFKFEEVSLWRHLE